MTPRRPRPAAIASIMAGLLLAILATASARDDPPKAKSLFDGKTIDGWKASTFYKPGEVKVEDGTIVLAPGGPMNGVTCTRTDLPTTNYELSYEAMRSSGSDFFAAATFPVGKSFITLVNGGWGGYVTGLSSLNGADASENDTTTSIKYKDKTWYAFRVRVTDKAIRCSLDGKEIIAVNHEGRQVKTRIEMNASQPLGFASYRTGGAVRKVEVRPLTAEEVAEVNKVE